MTDRVHVPTVRELAERNDGSAVATKWDADGKATAWRVFDKGHAVMGAAMRENALAAIARGEGNWTRPPSREIGGLKNAG
jgi:hypothetical protein